MVFVGTVLHGFCNGYFGRDSYENKRIEAVGVDWVVVRDSDGRSLFANFKSNEEMVNLINEWSKAEEE
jgi:hypothetical protein